MGIVYISHCETVFCISERTRYIPCNDLARGNKLTREIDRRLFEPSGIAVIGATPDLTRIGGQPIRALTQFGYRGRIYPVNPRHTTIAGLRTYSRATEIDGPCDLALVAVPAAQVPDVVRDCGRAGIPYIAVLSAGFRETGATGRALEDEMLAAARASGARLLGPNCQGLLNLASAVYAGFGAPFQDPDLPRGPMALVTQSGGVGFSIVMALAERRLGFDIVASTGNETDIDASEIVEALIDDDGIRVICLYLEGVRDGRRLMRAIRDATRAGKPVIVWKTGNTPGGAMAAASHTAQLTGSYGVYRSALRQAGAIAVNDIGQLADACEAFLCNHFPQGRRIASVGISGGAGILLADRLEEAGLTLACLSSETQEALSTFMPAFASANNPVDVTANVFNDPTLVDATLDAIASDRNVDIVSVLLASLSPQAAVTTANACARIVEKHRKPVFVAWTARHKQGSEALEILHKACIPVFDSPVRIADAAGRLAAFARNRTRDAFPQHPPLSKPLGLVHDGNPLDEAKLLDMLEQTGIRAIPRHFVPINRIESEECRCSFPVAVKVVSPDIPHKTEVKGVLLDVRTSDDARTAMKTVVQSAQRARPDARIRGVLLSSMVVDGLEIILGVVDDPAFGPVVTVGLGGVLTELLQDTSSRVAPVDIATAKEMLSELRAAPLLFGYRKRAPRDVEALAAAMVQLGNLAIATPAIAELEINPLFVMLEGDGVYAADALCSLRSTTPPPAELLRRASALMEPAA